MKKVTLLVCISIALVMVSGAGELLITESNAQGKSYKIGDKGPGGGYVFYDKGNSKGGWRYLETAPSDILDAKWGCFGKSIPGASGTAIGTGKVNTAAIIRSCSEQEIAAKEAAGYRGGGKNDWFLPSKDELDLMYKNLKKNGVGGFSLDGYWSSSADDARLAWWQSFDGGDQYKELKEGEIRVRPVRAF